MKTVSVDDLMLFIDKQKTGTSVVFDSGFTSQRQQVNRNGNLFPVPVHSPRAS